MEKEIPPFGGEEAFLEMVRARIAHGWVQGPHARNAQGKFVLPTDPAAVGWCLVGAVMHVADAWQHAFLYRGEAWLLNEAFARETERRAVARLSQHAATQPPGYASLAIFNEHPERTQADVLALIDTVLAAARKESGSRKRRGTVLQQAARARYAEKVRAEVLAGTGEP